MTNEIEPDDDYESAFDLVFDAPDGVHQVYFEDNGKVAYAYLVEGKSFVSHVWLYNVGPTPDSVDWDDPSQMPFPNPREYCSDQEVAPIREEGRLAVELGDAGADLYLDEALFARLHYASKPGESKLARVPNPLAKPLG